MFACYPTTKKLNSFDIFLNSISGAKGKAINSAYRNLKNKGYTDIYARTFDGCCAVSSEKNTRGVKRFQIYLSRAGELLSKKIKIKNFENDKRIVETTKKMYIGKDITINKIHTIKEFLKNKLIKTTKIDDMV